MASDNQSPPFGRIALIGFGLIGSSLGRVLRRDSLAGHIAVSARTQKTLEVAVELGLADSVSLDPAEAVKGADLVMVTTPLGVYGDVAQAIAPALKEGCIVSDVGSVKMAAIKDLGPHIPDGVHLVPGHPVAGTEHTGPEAGFAELFEGHWCILTPPPGTEVAAIDRVAELWRRCGMMIEVMDAAHHDQVLAITSHLPHMIAYTIVDTATDLEEHLQQEVVKFSAGGFRDFSRIAASDPVMWRDVCLANKEPILEMLGRFSEDLAALRKSIRRGDGEALHRTFLRTREIRRGVVKAKQDVPDGMMPARKKE